ncbi:MAG: DUF3367 domain-containing protein [Solirubrobacterales bacterium]|nr:DUF3367 domain-containing protein [Solirubrobacterales bacterium]
MRPSRAIPLVLAALSYALALVQRPGQVVADTKVHLYLDPGRFLGDVASLWSPTTDLGHVWAGQYGGYVWPMAPWFWLGDALGLPDWLVQRLWLGTILALAAWGVVRLLDALLKRERGAVHAAAGLLFAVNPYVTVYAGRASISLLAYAALPWLLLAIHRGLREPRGWRWPAIFALVLASAGGGVNAAVTAWVLVGPALLLVYELVWGGVPRAALRPLLVRLVPVSIVANLWWAVPLLLTARAAPNFLPFTEQPGTIWSTTSLTESLRLMGFWTSYVGVGYGGLLRPYQSSAPAMLQLAPVVVASLLVPAVALASFAWTRAWRYAPFFLLLTFAGLLIMVAGWPDGTPLRRSAIGVYYRVEPLQFLRTTYKAGALTALGLAVLGGAAFGLAWARWRRPLVAGGGVVLVVLAAWPLVTGRALERQLEFDAPASWRGVAARLDRAPDGTRAMVLPGQLFANYTWGGTVDAVLPPLTSHPVTTRWIVPFADLRSSDLQFAVDGLVTQERLKPGQLGPLLDWLGVGQLVVAADGDRSRSGEMPAGDALRSLPRGGDAFGPEVAAEPAADEIAGAPRTPSVRVIDRIARGGSGSGGTASAAAGPSTVRVLPRGPLTVVDGASGGITALAAFGALRADRPLVYGPDLDAAALRRAARDGASFVVSDGNRRRAFVAPRPKGQTGPTLPVDQGVSVDGNILDPFGDLYTSQQTVAVVGGVREVSAPASPQVTQLPDQRPFAAIDGDDATAWIADRALVPSRHVLTVRFDRPRDVDAVDLLPYSDSRAVVEEVEVGGKAYKVKRGWNRLRLGLRDVGELRVRLSKVTEPDEAPAGAGGIRELRIPGVRATEAMRPPTWITDALRGADLSRSGLTYLFERTTADVPRRQRRYVGERGAGELRDSGDPEPTLRRAFRPPAARTFAVDGWASIDPRTPDDVLDRLTGTRGARTWSSSRFDGLGRYRASGAFDGADRAWVGQWIGGRPAWVAWEAPRATTVRELQLDPPGVRVRRPTRVALEADGREGSAVRVSPTGAVALPAPVRGRSFRLRILDAAFPEGTPDRVKQRRAVGIGEVRGDGVPRVAVARGCRVELPCGAGALGVGSGAGAAGSTLDAGRSAAVPFRATVDRDTLDAGGPVRVRGCRALALGAEAATVVGSTGPLRLDSVRLASPGRGPAPVGGGRVERVDGAADGARVRVDGPSWLVLGQSYDRFWRASCDGRDLGEPRPMQGYANGWPVDRGCRDVAFAYKPQRIADAGYLVSAIGCAALLALLGAGAVRRRREVAARAAAPDRPAPGAAPPGLWPGTAPVPAAHPWPWRAALLAAGCGALVIAYTFGLRAGAVALPLLALLLRRGIGDRALSLAAGALLGVVVPLIYLGIGLFDDDTLGGNSTQYAADRLAAHWVGVAAVVLLAIVLLRTLAPRFRRPGDREDEPLASRPVSPDPDPSLR